MKPTKEFKKQFEAIKSQLPEQWKAFKVVRNDKGSHPITYKDIECAFATAVLDLPQGSNILNVGSYTQYIVGLLSNYNITTLDVREREAFLDNELVIAGDIKNAPLANGTFDAIISLSSIEHFGLGRYGDELDIEADKKAFERFKLLLKPNGLLIFTTTIRQGGPELCFNAHKTYTKDIIYDFCFGLELVTENFVKKNSLTLCEENDITNIPKEWDIYCGCWCKNERVL